MIAEFLFIMTAVPVIYYFFNLYDMTGRTRYLVGLMAGGWGFLGSVLVIGGVVGFSYYILYLILLVLVFLYEKIMGLLDDTFDGGGGADEQVRWPVEVSNSGMGVVTVMAVVFCYFMFLITPVSPARIDDPIGFDEEEGSYKALPNGYMYEYKKADGTYVVVLTIRSIPISRGMLEDKLEKGSEEVEEHIRERYGTDTSIRYTDDATVTIRGYDAVEKDFDIYSTGLLGTQIGSMTLQAFFYPRDLEIIVLGYFYLPGRKETTVGITDRLIL